MLCDKQLFESVKRNETTGALLRFETTTGPASIAYIYRKGNRYKDLDQNLTVNYYLVPSN